MKQFFTQVSACLIFCCIALEINAQVIYEYADSQVTNKTACVSCEVHDSLSAVDNDLTTFSELEMQAGFPGASVSQTLIYPTNACARDTIYIVVQNPFLAVDGVLPGVSISTSFQLNENNDEQTILNASILPGNLTLIKYAPVQAYDRVRVKITGGVANGITNLRIYYSYRFSELPQFEGNTFICQGQSTILTLKPIRSFTTYEWYDQPVGGNLLFTGNTDFFTGSLSDTMVYYVQRCANAIRLPFIITVIDKPDKPAILGQTVICKGSQVNLQATSSFSQASFKWFDIGGNEVITNNFYSAILYEDTRYVVYTVLNGCYSEPDTVFIDVIEPLMVPQVTCGTPTINSVLFEWPPVPEATGYEISLDFGATYIPANGTNSHMINSLNFGDARTLFVRALGGPPCGDGQSSSGVTCIATNCSAVIFDSPDMFEICREDTAVITLTNISAPGYEVSWDNAPFAAEATYKKTITESSIVRVEVRDAAQPGCPTTVKYIPVNLLPSPEAAFSSDKQLVTVPNGSIQFFDNTIGAQSWSWDFGDGGTSTERNPVHIYNAPGKYTVKLNVTNVYGCNDEIIQADFTEGKYAPQLVIPNTFTPNGDELNDVFKPKGERIQEYHIQIFNPAGKLIFNSRSVTDNWDGTYNGEPQPTGPYYYKVDALADDNIEFHFKGIINLVR